MEYKVISTWSTNHADLAAALNRWAAEGWRVITARIRTKYDNVGIECVLERSTNIIVEHPSSVIDETLFEKKVLDVVRRSIR